MLNRLAKQLLAWIKTRSILKFCKQSEIKAFALLFIIGLGLSVAIAYFSPSDFANSANAAKQEPQQSHLTVLKMGSQKGIALLNIIKAQGSLEKRLQAQGISVTWTEYSSTASLLDGIGAGAIAFGGGGGTGSLFAQANNKPFVRVAVGTSNSRGSAILVLENSPIKTLEDLKGKKVAFAKGSGQHYVIVRALEKVGLTFNDIQPIYLTPTEALPAFERGDIDAWLIKDPYTAEAEHKLHTRLLADSSTIFGGKTPLENPNFYYASPDFVRHHPDIVKVIIEELNKAGNWSKKNYQDSAKLLYKLYKIDLSTMEIVEKRSEKRQILPVSDQALSGLQKIADTFYEVEIISKKIDVKDKKYNWMPDQKS